MFKKHAFYSINGAAHSATGPGYTSLTSIRTARTPTAQSCLGNCPKAVWGIAPWHPADRVQELPTTPSAKPLQPSRSVHHCCITFIFATSSVRYAAILSDPTVVDLTAPVLTFGSSAGPAPAQVIAADRCIWPRPGWRYWLAVPASARGKRDSLATELSTMLQPMLPGPVEGKFSRDRGISYSIQKTAEETANHAHAFANQ